MTSARIAGPDTTGAGKVLPGFGNRRAIELLVDAGVTPLEATRNGAIYLSLAGEIGLVAVGKRAPYAQYQATH